MRQTGTTLPCRLIIFETLHLRRVPATELGVFALAAELLDEHGELDVDAAAARQPELHLALVQAEAYARGTRQAAEALRRLPPG